MIENIYEYWKMLCKEKGTSISNLCIQVTGNSGNLATWQKGYMRSDFAVKCADILGVSVDYLLGRDDKKKSPVITTEDGYNELAERITHLSHSELEELDLYLAFLEYRRNLRS